MTVSSIQISSSLLAYSLLTPGWAFTKHFMKFKYLKRYFTTDGFELSDNFINGHPFFQDRNLVKVLCSDLNFDAWSNFVTGTGRDMGSFFLTLPQANWLILMRRLVEVILTTTYS